MNEFKGTPGPWALNGHGAIVGGKFHEYANGSAQSQVAMVVGSREVDEQEMKANAVLIAASPVLLHELLNLEVAANTAVLCYELRPENFAAALMELQRVAGEARRLTQEILK